MIKLLQKHNTFFVLELACVIGQKPYFKRFLHIYNRKHC